MRLPEEPPPLDAQGDFRIASPQYYSVSEDATPLERDWPSARKEERVRSQRDARAGVH